MDVLEKFYQYLCEVVVYYQKNGSLRNFSQLAKKHEVKALPKEWFFIYNLHLIKRGELPSRRMSDMIRAAISKKDRNYKRISRYKAGDIVAWEDNGFRSVAVMRGDGLFSICLNFRSREDEQNRLWEVDSIPDNVKVEKANLNDMKRLINFLVEDCYRENLEKA